MKLSDLKFRAWDEDNGDFVFSDDENLALGHCDGMNHLWYDSNPFPPDVEIELWSGFYDSEGKEIYEGDILQCSEGHRVAVVFRGWIFCVRLETNSFGGSSLAEHLSISSDLRVVGNIHEEAK